MNSLIGKDILLRALEPSDLDFLYEVENNENVWEVSNTIAPFSKEILTQYLNNSHRDIYEVKQLRLVISLIQNNRPIGLIDLFEFDPKHQRVGLGIVISAEVERRKGFATQALKMICNYAFAHLNVHQLYANIAEDNVSSIELFKKVGFLLAGVKKDWINSQGKFKNECMYQLIRDVS